MKKILINGALVAEDSAVISVHDRGFRFGDGVFETIALYKGIPYLWGYHMERLTAGLKALRIAYDTERLLKYVQMLNHENNVGEGLIRIQISRGSGGYGYLPSGTSPTLVIQNTPLPPAHEKPFSLWLSQYEKPSPYTLPTHAKLAQGLNSTLARMEAAEQGYDEALQLSHEKYVAEASSANIFWFSQDTLYTPSLETGALAGITRRRMIELSPYPVLQGYFTLESLRDAKAVFLTNAARGIIPVHSLKPMDWTWESLTLSEEFAALRLRDMPRA